MRYSHIIREGTIMEDLISILSDLVTQMKITNDTLKDMAFYLERIDTGINDVTHAVEQVGEDK